MAPPFDGASQRSAVAANSAATTAAKRNAKRPKLSVQIPAAGSNVGALPSQHLASLPSPFPAASGGGASAFQRQQSPRTDASLLGLSPMLRRSPRMSPFTGAFDAGGASGTTPAFGMTPTMSGPNSLFARAFSLPTPDGTNGSNWAAIPSPNLRPQRRN